MGLLFGRKTQPRKFDYTPRYYDPRKDDSLKRRMRIQSRVRRRRSPIALYYLAALLLTALYIYNALGR
ncbi:MAG: hypothetical protein F4058_01545 [Rhodothermaceae bacterium]|nr:hypothetical protein [Bacteroidota bacterium]MXW82992.1 hypothetical protein [Rhodothermaceae bacterium]MDE2672389.1 hypothetical protein [Bacteroidota bacterium]MDE2827587.1 hypothetical protein [Bacteroidota bacterium]MXX57420.1 hypothetical protein [Rhodothermaceae bacterium]